MEGRRGAKNRSPMRCYECSRSEEELWKLAYERLLPMESRRRESNELRKRRAGKWVIAAVKGAQSHG